MFANWRVGDKEKSFITTASVVTLSLSLMAEKNKLVLVPVKSVTKKNFITLTSVVTVVIVGKAK